MTTAVTEQPVLYSTLASDPDLGELVDLFVSELPARVKSLQAALDEADFDAVGRFAHQLKGAAGSYGFEQLTPTLKQLELLAREHRSLESVQSGLTAVRAMCQRVRSGVPT